MELDFEKPTPRARAAFARRTADMIQEDKIPKK